MGRTLGSTEWPLLFCLNWYDFEPFECDIWYTTTKGFVMKMDSNYIITKEPTMETWHSLKPSASPPPLSVNVTGSIPNNGPLRQSSNKWYHSWVTWSIAAFSFCSTLICLMVYCRKRSTNSVKKFVDFSHNDSNQATSVYGNDNGMDILSASPSNVELNTLRTKSKKTKTTKTSKKGEHIQVIDESEDDDEDVIGHDIIDETEGDQVLMTAPFHDDDSDDELYGGTTKKSKSPKTWVKFEE